MFEHNNSTAMLKDVMNKISIDLNLTFNPGLLVYLLAEVEEFFEVRCSE